MKQITFVATAILIAVFSVGAPLAHAQTYQPMTVRDFMIDADALVRSKAHIEVSGVYMMAGALDELYAGVMEAASVQQGYANPPFIPLLTDHASRALRGTLFDCRSSGAYYCMITIRGIVTRCTLSNIVGTRETVCIGVEDGGIYQPPRPTAEQIAQQQAAAAEAERQRAVELSKEVVQWEQTVENCIANSAQAGFNATAPQNALGQFIGRLANPARAKAADANNKALAASRLYEICASQPWPAGAAAPDRLPDPIQNVIDQCTAVRDWRFCTNGNPPRS
jgi:hypothetical protein